MTLTYDSRATMPRTCGAHGSNEFVDHVKPQSDGMFAVSRTYIPCRCFRLGTEDAQGGRVTR